MKRVLVPLLLLFALIAPLTACATSKTPVAHWKASYSWCSNFPSNCAEIQGEGDFFAGDKQECPSYYNVWDPALKSFHTWTLVPDSCKITSP
jgi:hypothetical protein